MHSISAAESSHIHDHVSRAIHQLVEAAVTTDVHANFVPSRRTFLWRRRAQLMPMGRVWPIGVFLLSPEGALFESGESVRAVPANYPGHTSRERERRRALIEVAERGPFERGEVIHFATRTIDVSPGATVDTGGLLVFDDNEVGVRWNRRVPNAQTRPFAEYLAERVTLLIDPEGVF